jgi:hypothetical protein
MHVKNTVKIKITVLHLVILAMSNTTSGGFASTRFNMIRFQQITYTPYDSSFST